MDQIRHVIIFHQASEGESGLYRVRAVNALGEAECEAELCFDGSGGTGDDMYLPPLWKERKRLNWKDEDQRKKPFVGYKEPELTPEELAEMRKKHGGVPLNRIMEYLASLPDYVPSDKFRGMERMPFKAGVDEHDYRPERKGGKTSYPSVFKKGKFDHHGYKSDVIGRILPVWYNKGDPRSSDSSHWKWLPVHPDLYVPNLPPVVKGPDGPPVWESDEDIKNLVAFLHSMGCSRVDHATEIKQARSNHVHQRVNEQSHADAQLSASEFHATQEASHARKQASKVEKFSYTRPNADASDKVETGHLPKAKTVKNMWEDRLNANTAGAQSNAEAFTAQFMSSMYEKKDNMSFPELAVNDQSSNRPALPPKTKIMNSPSRSIFSPTESIESNSAGTAASVKTVEFMPVKEKIKLIAAQQEELNRKEEASAATSSSTEKKHKGVRILPPSPVTVRKMSVEEELYQYDEVVTRSTPVTQVMEKMQNKPDATNQQDIFTPAQAPKSVGFADTDYSTLDSGFSNSHTSFESKSASQMSFSSSTVQHQSAMSSTHQMSSQAVSVPGWGQDTKIMKQEALAKSAAEKEVNQALDQLVTGSMSSESMFSTSESSSVQQQHYQSFATSSSMQSTRTQVQSSSLQTGQSKTAYETPAEECRRSFEEAELEAMALESETSRSYSKQSSMVETSSVQSFVFQDKPVVPEPTGQKPAAVREASESESSFRSSRPQKSSSFVRTPASFTANHAPVASAPTTPLSQRRRLRVNQSPALRESSETRQKYRESPTAPFQPGFYRLPPEDPDKAHAFQARKLLS